MRRGVLLALAVPALLLAACGQAPTAARARAPVSAAATSSASAAHFPLTIVDDTGRSVLIPHRPQRIVSVTEGTDEVLLGGLVPRARVVGVTQFAAEPDQSWVASRVGGITQLSTANAEQILALRPDLVFVASYTTPGVVAQLQGSGIPVIEFKNFSDVADIESHILTMGRAVGNLPGAEAMVAKMKAELAAVAARVRGLPPARLLYYTPDGYVFGKGTTPDQLVADAGGLNLADGAGITAWKQVTLGTVAALKPDWLLTDQSQPGFAAKLLKAPVLAAVPAVRAHHVLALPSRDLTVLSQYFAQAVRVVAADLHPSAFGH